MSMISAQIDELRQMADGQATYRDARAAMLQAADTIWQLRDDLQRANTAVQDAEHDESMAWDRVRKAEAEVTELREDNDRLIQAIEDLHNVSLEDELVRLENENAKLREELEVVETAAYLYGRDDLKAESARLRRGTTTRHAKHKTKYGRKVPLCECCNYSIGDMRWHFCPNCGAEVVDE